VRVSQSRRVLFVHVQKTGGSSVQHLLDECLPDSTALHPKHAGLERTLKRHPELAGYWTFGFVRNPWARMVSWWSMIQGLKQQDPQHRFFVNQAMWRDVAAYPDFDTFVTKGPEQFVRLGRPQWSYLHSKDGRRADFIGRTETFETDMRAVSARLDLPQVELPHLTRSEHGDYRDFYSDTSRAHVATLFQPDIRAFGYEF
jgi:hypothetical protein